MKKQANAIKNCRLALHVAAQIGEEQVGIYPCNSENHRDMNHNSPIGLIMPPHLPHYSQVASLLAKGGMPVDGRDSLGQTPLHHAARRDNWGVCKALIGARANLSQ
eukprot:1349745-Amorphochlora_amoeboformis.AAC.1